MISLEQWRVSIGSFHSRRCLARNKTGCCGGSSGRVAVFSLCDSVCSAVHALVIVALLLVCCGDIETNPGPLGMVLECCIPVLNNPYNRVKCCQCSVSSWSMWV